MKRGRAKKENISKAEAKGNEAKRGVVAGKVLKRKKGTGRRQRAAEEDGDIGWRSREK